MGCLKILSRNHSIAILTSIHQPNCDILMLFDQLYVLSLDGQCIYNGHPSALKQHLIECQISLLEYQVPIEQLIEVASSNHLNSDLFNKLISKTRNYLVLQEELRISKGDLLKRNFYKKNKQFSLIDLLTLLRRSINNELIGGWKVESTFLMTLIFYVFLMINIFPNDIGTDPGCTQDAIDLKNISSINQRILDALTGNEQKYQQNIKYNYFIVLMLFLVNTIQICYSFDGKVIIIL